MLFRSAVLVAWVVWFGGWTLLKRALPADMTSNVFDDSGDVRVAMPKPDPNGAPWKQKAYDPDDDDHGKAKAKKGAADDEDSDDDDSPAADKDNAQVNAALDAAVARVDAALAEVAAKSGDQTAVAKVETAIVELSHVSLPKDDSALGQAAKERRSELVTQKKAALEQAKRSARSTHAIAKGTDRKSTRLNSSHT